MEPHPFRLRDERSRLLQEKFLLVSRATAASADNERLTNANVQLEGDLNDVRLASEEHLAALVKAQVE